MSLDVLKNVLLSLNQTILEFVTGRGSTPPDSDKDTNTTKLALGSIILDSMCMKYFIII